MSFRRISFPRWRTNLTNITLTITDNLALDADSANNPDRYAVHLRTGGGELTIFSAALVNSSNIVLTTSPRTQSRDYTIVLNGITDRAVAANAAAPSTRAVIGSIVVLTPDATTLWRYDASSNDLDGVAWQTKNFDDLGWPTALAGFTTSNDLEITTNGFELHSTNMFAPATLGPVTTYYRVPFHFPGATANARLEIVGVVDDGMVVYINGIEAGRLRVTNASPVSFTNLASAGSPETANTHLPLDKVSLTNLSGLVNGGGICWRLNCIRRAWSAPTPCSRFNSWPARTSFSTEIRSCARVTMPAQGR
jgi:hypothetical protein